MRPHPQKFGTFLLLASTFLVGCAEPSSCAELATCPSDASVSSADASSESTQASASNYDAGPTSPGRVTEVPFVAPGPSDASASETRGNDAGPSDMPASDAGPSYILANDAGLSDAAVHVTPGDAGEAKADSGQSDACADEDCDSQTPSCVDPSATDSCMRGADENCDGLANSPLDPACECVVGQSTCADGAPSTERKTCDAEGLWGAWEPCPYVCEGEGVCGGVCSPSARLCNGNDVVECGTDGQWQDQGACPATTPCQGEGECLECPEGSYAAGGTCLPFTECAPGQFIASPGTSTSNTVCSACPSGAFSDAIDAVDCAAWTNCAAGQFVAAAGSSATDRQCAPCAVGTFSGAANALECAACGSGQFSDVEGSSSCGNWSTCIPGTYVSAAGNASSDRQCTACEWGSFSTANGVSACAPHTSCGVGYTESSPGTRTSDCTCTPSPSCIEAVNQECGIEPFENCCTSLLVSGGSFELLNLGSSATIDTFQLDKFEVTVGRFRSFVAAWDGGYRPAGRAGKHTHLNEGNGLFSGQSTTVYEPGWDVDWENFVDTSDGARGTIEEFSTWTGYDDQWQPVNHINWYEAYAFCIWDGAFLPSSTELYYAATGGAEQRSYPWSSPPSSTEIGATNAGYECRGNGNPSCTYNDIIGVGAYRNGLGRYGQQDLAGNVDEWALDSGSLSCTDCASFPDSTSRVVHGGAYDASASDLLAPSYESAATGTRRSQTGFRCARAD